MSSDHNATSLDPREGALHAAVPSPNLAPHDAGDDDECGCERLDDGECGCISDQQARLLRRRQA